MFRGALKRQSSLIDPISEMTPLLPTAAPTARSKDTRPYSTRGSELHEQQLRIKEESKQSTAEYIGHKFKRMFTFKREDALPAVRLSDGISEVVNPPNQQSKNRIFSSKTKTYVWDEKTSQEVTALWGIENFEHRNPSKLNKVALARAFYEMREHQRGKEKHEKLASVWWTKDKWRCDKAIEALLDAFNNPVNFDQLKNGMAAGGTGYDHRGKVIWATNLSESPAVVGQALKLASSSNPITMAIASGVTSVLTAFAYSKALVVGLERFKNKPRERLANEMDPQLTESLNNAPSVDKLRPLTKKMLKLIEQKKGLDSKNPINQQELLNISLEIQAIEVEVKSRGINTATEVMGTKRQLPARIAAGFVKSAGALASGLTLNPLPLIIAQGVATTPHLLYHFSGAEGRDSEDKGYAKMLGLLKSPEWINTNEISRDQVADLYRDSVDKKISESELEAQLANAFNLELIANSMKFPIGNRLDVAKRLFEGKISEAMQKLAQLEHEQARQKNGLNQNHLETQNEKQNEKQNPYKVAANSLAKDYLYLNKAMDLQKEAEKEATKPAEQQDNDLIKSLQDEVAEELSKIESKDFHILFCGSLSEQAKVCHEADKLTLGEEFKYLISYGANGAWADGTNFVVGEVLSGVALNKHVAEASGEKYSGPDFFKYEAKQITAIAAAGAGHVSGWRANDKVVGWGKVWDGALWPAGISHGSANINLSGQIKKEGNVTHETPIPSAAPLDNTLLEITPSEHTPFNSFVAPCGGTTIKEVELKMGDYVAKFSRDNTQPFADELWKRAGFRRRMSELRLNQFRTARHLVWTNVLGTVSVLFGHKWLGKNSVNGRMHISKKIRRDNNENIGHLKNSIQHAWFDKIQTDLNHPEYLHMARHGECFGGMVEWLAANRVDYFKPGTYVPLSRRRPSLESQNIESKESNKKKYDKEARLVEVKGKITGFDALQKLLAQEAGTQNHFVLRADNGQFFVAKRDDFKAKWGINGRSLEEWFAEGEEGYGRSVQEIAFVYPTQTLELQLEERKTTLPELERPFWHSTKLKAGAPEVPVGAYLGMDLKKMFKSYEKNEATGNSQRAPVSPKNQHEREKWQRQLNQRAVRRSING